MNRWLLSGLILLLLAACFESMAPLSPPGQPACGNDQFCHGTRFVGTWNCTSADMAKSETMIATILPFDAQQLLIELKDSSDPEPTRYRFYPTLVSAGNGSSQPGKGKAVSQILWNAQELKAKETPAKWNFVRIKQPKSTELIAQVVQDDALAGSSESDKMANLRERLMDESIYGAEVRCTLVP